MKTLTDIAIEAAGLAQAKYEASNASLSNVARVLELIYPMGISPDDYFDVSIMIRVIDKFFRISGEKYAFNENPWKDILEYILLATYEEEKQSHFEEETESL